MNSELSVEIERPIGEVFKHTNDDVTAWSITCVEEEVLDRKPGEVGTTFRLVTADRGRRMEFQGVVTRYDPPTASSVHLDGQHFDLDVDYTFEDLGNRTRVTQRSQVRGKGFARVMLGLFGWLMSKAGCKAQDAELQSLKKHCESRSA